MRISLLMFLPAIVLCACKPYQEKGEIYYQGRDISDFARIERDAATKAAVLTVSESDDWNEAWELYGGRSVESIDYAGPLMAGDGGGTFAVPVPDSVRSYFMLVAKGEREASKGLTADRLLPMAGGSNFRDLGGIRTVDGYYVKWGKLIRSDDLHDLTDADLRYLSSVPLLSVVDFRSASEIEARPDRIPKSVKGVYACPVAPGDLETMAAELAHFTPGQVDSLMMAVNVQLVTDPASIGALREFFGLVQHERNLPVLFHCSAGKDRTGMAAALVLYALGVDENIILYNYMESNRTIGAKYAAYVERYPNLKPLFAVKEGYLLAGIDRIKQDHGSVARFLTDVLKVDLQKMRDLYLD